MCLEILVIIFQQENCKDIIHLIDLELDLMQLAAESKFKINVRYCFLPLESKDKKFYSEIPTLIYENHQSSHQECQSIFSFSIWDKIHSLLFDFY